MGGPRALATAALYLVLKSNGLHRPKIRLKKFGFSLKTVPANIAKKLPPQRCFKPLLIPIFNFSYKRPTFAFTSESGYALAFAQRIAHNGSHGETRGCFGWGRYYYPRSVPHVSETLRGQMSERQTLPFLGLGRVCSRRTQKAFGTAMRLCASLSRGVAAPAGCVIFFRFCRNCGLYALFQILLSVLQTLQLVPFLCKLRLSSFLFGSEFNGFRSKQAGFFAIIFETV